MPRDRQRGGTSLYSCSRKWVANDDGRKHFRRFTNEVCTNSVFVVSKNFAEKNIDTKTVSTGRFLRIGISTEAEFFLS